MLLGISVILHFMSSPETGDHGGGPFTHGKKLDYMQRASTSYIKIEYLRENKVMKVFILSIF
jgi:hypothetical protein